MISEIYVNQVFQSLAIFFYEECLGKIGEIIYMDDDVTYYTSKLTKKSYAEVGLLCIIWQAQFLDFNPIENLWRIIKIQVSSYCHRIHSVEEMKVVISE